MMSGEYTVTLQLKQKRDKSCQLKILNRNLSVNEEFSDQKTSC